jgi:hypothetical protein
MDSPDPADRSRLRDLAALAAHTAHPLPTFAQTEALLRARLAGPTSPRSQESLLTRWKRTPALTAAIAAIGLAAAAPAAYALAQQAQTIWIDTDADADTIAADVQGQLADQGIAADVTAERTDDSITVGISTDDPRAAALTAATSAGETSSLRLRVEVRCELDAGAGAGPRRGVPGSGVRGRARRQRRSLRRRTHRHRRRRAGQGRLHQDRNLAEQRRPGGRDRRAADVTRAPPLPMQLDDEAAADLPDGDAARPGAAATCISGSVPKPVPKPPTLAAPGPGYAPRGITTGSSQRRST